jgi:hypothetical protein
MLASVEVQDYLSRFKQCSPRLGPDGAVHFEESPALPRMLGRLLGSKKESAHGACHYALHDFATDLCGTEKTGDQSSPDVRCTHVLDTISERRGGGGGGTNEQGRR